jgi:hypothetical protein
MEHQSEEAGPMVARLFPVAQVVATRGAVALMETARINPDELLQRQQAGDWVTSKPEDRRENDYAVGRRLRIFSAYGKPPDRARAALRCRRSKDRVHGDPAGKRQRPVRRRRSR